MAFRVNLLEYVTEMGLEIIGLKLMKCRFAYSCLELGRAEGGWAGSSIPWWFPVGLSGLPVVPQWPPSGHPFLGERTFLT